MWRTCIWRASEWYEQNGKEQSGDIRHALATEDFERAADLIEVAIPAMRGVDRKPLCVAGWKALPR